jgi:glycosyltransferase involved in cell wall biosynthesis
MEVEAVNEADYAIAITRPLIEHLERAGAEPNKLRLLPNGVDTERFRPEARDPFLEQTLGLEGLVVIGYVGSMVAYEGLELLLHAARNLSFLRSRIRFLFVGDGDQYEHLRDLARVMDIDDMVLFTGRVPHGDIKRYYSLIDIAPFPRLPLPVTEAVSPLKPFEALAMNKIVLFSDCRALQDIAASGAPGWSFPAGDSSAMTELLLRVIQFTKEFEDAAAYGREWVQMNREWKSLANRLGNLYVGEDFEE